MWPFQKKRDEIVSILFWQKHLTLCWIQQFEKQSALYLKAYQHIPLNNLELDQLILYSPTVIDHHIKAFFDLHKLHQAYVLFGLHGTLCNERLIPLSTATPTPDQLELPHSQDWEWEYRYLYPMDQGNYMFYASGIPKKVLFSYQLLALRNNLNLLKITPRTLSLYQLYKHLYGNSFRNSQLGIHMQLHNNAIEQFFTPDIITRMLYIPSNHGITPRAALPLLAHASGLFVSERSL